MFPVSNIQALAYTTPYFFSFLLEVGSLGVDLCVC